MAFMNIRVEISEPIATLTIDRPAVKNALNLETVQECHAALAEVAANAGVGVLIVTGAGELDKKILRQGPLAARLAKVALNASWRVDLDSGLLIETLAQAICYDSEDKQEGTAPFLEKRKPKFTST